MVYGWLTIGSVILGLVALILPTVNLLRSKKSRNRHWMLLSLFSISACAIAIVFQILYTNYLVAIEDWSALMDTSRASALISSILLILTLGLNVITMTVYREKT